MRLDDARRGLDAAAKALAALRNEAGLEAPPEGGPAERAALEAARRGIEERSRELEAARLRIAALEEERASLIERAAGARPDPQLAERARIAESEAARVRQAAQAEIAALNGRLSIQQAELVRLSALRRKAEEGAEQGELTRRDVEEALRRDLRSANGALDRAAADAGTREARAQADIQGLTRRLEAALARAEQVSREHQAERERWRVERSRLASSLQRAAAVHAALRREIDELRNGPPAV